MQTSTTLRTSLLALCLLFLFHNISFSQLEFKIQLMPEDNIWGVYVRPHESITPVGPFLTGSGQVTVVASAETIIESSYIENYGGRWDINSRVNQPSEAPGYDYISFGFQIDNPSISINEDSATLLFTFKVEGDCPDTLFLIDNELDPFNDLPNSMGSNPGNEMTIIDLSQGIVYDYQNNYAFCEWSCKFPCETEEQNTTPTNSIINNSTFSIYPNPVKDNFTLEINSAYKGDISATIYNCIGKEIYAENAVIASKTQFETSGFSPGMYLLQVEIDGKVIATQKFLRLE